MDPPDNCPNGLYSVMKSCWSMDPRTRPDFETLKALLSKSFGELERGRRGGYLTISVYHKCSSIPCTVQVVCDCVCVNLQCVCMCVNLQFVCV